LKALRFIVPALLVFFYPRPRIALLARYSAATVAPFSLLAACAGIAASVLIFGDAFGPAPIAGILLILAGLAIIVPPARWLDRLRFVLDRTGPSR
jgi:hypothetical protein